MLVIDIGNSSLKWTHYRAGSLGPAQRVFHNNDLSPGRMTELWGGLQKPRRALVSSVAGAHLNQALADWVGQCWGLAAEFATAQAQGLGLTSSYAQPQQLGVDRWLAMAAAHNRENGDCCVISVGTAVTVDLLRADGQHLGGWIAPGRALMRSALTQGTAGIPSGQAEPETVWGTDTQSATMLGAEAAIVGLAQRALVKAEQSLVQPKVYLTGGDAMLLKQVLGKDLCHQPDLVLQGLVLWSRSC